MTPAQALEEWQRGRWQAAHEAFEALWRDCQVSETDPRAELWRALAQAAAVGVLQRQGRRNGARAVASKAAARLRLLAEEHGSVIAGIDVRAAAENLKDCVEDASKLGPLLMASDGVDHASGNSSRS